MEVWEENCFMLDLFTDYITQWRVGVNGVIGLDYNVFHHALDRKGIKGEEYEECIWSLSVIEAAAMQEIRKT